MHRATAFVALIALGLAACAVPGSDVQSDVEAAATASEIPADSQEPEPTQQEEKSGEDQDSAGAQTQLPLNSASVQILAREDDPVGDVDDVESSTSEEETVDEPIAQPTSYPGPVAFAIADLAARLGIDESLITLVSYESVVWPDGGLGCPQPGMEYIQVLVDGSSIVLAVANREFRYHSGGGSDPFLCLNPVAGGLPK